MALSKLNKVLRFLMIYGLGRTLYKVIGRSRRHMRLFRPKPSSVRDIGLIGCGQFGFATIGYILCNRFDNRFIDCYDIDVLAQRSFSEFFRIPNPSNSALEVIRNPKTRVIYIASNHASHSDYATEAIAAGKAVYVEKPISVNVEQLRQLLSTIRKTGGEVFAGYNRPFSAAIRQLHRESKRGRGAITLNCFISGHRIADDHWYRKPEEGTRICGNVGHWLDLAVHMLNWNELPDKWKISLAYSSDMARDDDLAISLTSVRGDLVNIVLTARCEPFEGIHETINFQQGEVIASINDFRNMTVWSGDKLKKLRYWPKDVGHSLAISQPFSEIKRNWHEVELSTILMLYIKNMVEAGERFSEFSFSREWEKIGLE